MPRVIQPKPEDGRRLRDRIALGVLTATYPQDLVDQAIESTGKRDLRYRLLPARMVVYYVLAMTLSREAGYEEVLRELTEGLLGRARNALQRPSSVAISKARARLGSAPLKALFTAACVPLAQLDSRGAFYRGWRVVSMDGTTLDTADNVQTFGRPGSTRGESAFPQLRIVALAESVTKAIFAAAMGAYGTGEPTLARQLVTAIDPGVLILADRGFTAPPVFGHGWDRSAAVLARQGQCGPAGAGALFRWFVPLRVGGITRQAQP